MNVLGPVVTVRTDAEWGDLVDVLPGRTQSFPRGHQDVELVCAAEQGHDHVRAGVEYVFARIEDEQTVARLQG